MSIYSIILSIIPLYPRDQGLEYDWLTGIKEYRRAFQCTVLVRGCHVFCKRGSLLPVGWIGFGLYRAYSCVWVVWNSCSSCSLLWVYCRLWFLQLGSVLYEVQNCSLEVEMLLDVASRMPRVWGFCRGLSCAFHHQCSEGREKVLGKTCFGWCRAVLLEQFLIFHSSFETESRTEAGVLHWCPPVPVSTGRWFCVFGRLELGTVRELGF